MMPTLYMCEHLNVERMGYEPLWADSGPQFGGLVSSSRNVVGAINDVVAIRHTVELWQ
jgi:hypothetical protein